MQKNRLQSLSLIIIATAFTGLSSCQKEIKTEELSKEITVNPEIKAKSYREFDSLLKADPNLVIRISDSDFNDPDEVMTEQQFLDKARLVSMPGKYIPDDQALQGRVNDGVVTLPEITVYGSWPEFPTPCSLNYLCTRNYLIAFPSYNYYINQGLSSLLAIYKVKTNDPLSSVVNTNILPDLWAVNNGRGKIKYVLEKIDNSHYKASIGVTSGLLPYSSGLSKGSIELILKTITPTFDAPFQSASFQKAPEELL